MTDLFVAQIQHRRDTAAHWTTAHPVLAEGEWGYETDTGKYKIGDGVLEWPSLGYTSTNTIYHYISIPADKWKIYTPLSEGGTGAEFATEQLSNGIVRTYLGFGYASAQYAYTGVDMPADWDGAALTMQTFWETASGTLNTCEFEIYGARVANAATSNVTLSTKLFTITDTNTGAGYRNESAEVALASITGTGNHIALMLTRDYGTDTLDADVKFLGAMLKCTVVKV